MVAKPALHHAAGYWRLLGALLLSVTCPSALAATLTIVVDGVRDASGAVAIAVYSGDKGFPKDPSQAIRSVMAPIDLASHSARAVLQSMPVGVYAIAAFHDDNNTGKLETNLFGMPVKGYGFSNNPAPKMRAARYDEASFALPANGAAVTIRLKY